MLEEEYKHLRRIEEPFYHDAQVYKKYDLISVRKLYIAEFKVGKETAEEMIFQSILTAAKENESFLCYICDSPLYRNCIYGFDIDLRYLYEIKENPSNYNKNLFLTYKDQITKILKPFPDYNYLCELEHLKEVHNNMTDKEYNRHTVGFGKIFNKNLFDTKNLRVSDEDRQKTGAYYTPQEVCNKIKVLVDKHWKYDKVCDPCAGDGHLAKTISDNVILCDINQKIVASGGIIKNAFDGILPKGFNPKTDIIVTNIPYGKKNCRKFLSMCKENKVRIAIIEMAAHFPIEEMPIIDGFFTKGWGAGEGQFVLLLDYNQEPIKEIMLDYLFQCEAPTDAIDFPGRGMVRCNMDLAQQISTIGSSGRKKNRRDLNKFSPGEFVTENIINQMRNSIPKGDIMKRKPHIVQHG